MKNPKNVKAADVLYRRLFIPQPCPEFHSIISENEKGLIYNKISALREHEEDVL